MGKNLTLALKNISLVPLAEARQAPDLPAMGGVIGKIALVPKEPAYSDITAGTHAADPVSYLP